MSEIETAMQQAADERWFGKIELDYQDGRLMLIKKTQCIRPASAQNPTQTEHTDAKFRRR